MSCISILIRRSGRGFVYLVVLGRRDLCGLEIPMSVGWSKGDYSGFHKYGFVSPTEVYLILGQTRQVPIAPGLAQPLLVRPFRKRKCRMKI